MVGRRDVDATIAEMEKVLPSTPLCLEVAARLAFPDGTISVSALRRLLVAGKITHEFFAGKYFVTLAAIEEFRVASRIQAKPQNSNRKSEMGKASSMEEAANPQVAQDALHLIAEELKASLRKGATDRGKPAIMRRRRTNPYKGTL